MPAWTKSLLLVLLIARLVLGGAGMVSCAERDGTRAVEWVAAGCCDARLATDPADLAGAGGGAHEAGECGACSDELLAATVIRPERADASSLLPSLTLVDVVAADPLALTDRPRGPSAASGCPLEADATPRALRPAVLRC